MESSACKKVPWCVQQIGHEGECSETWWRQGSSIEPLIQRLLREIDSAIDSQDFDRVVDLGRAIANLRAKERRQEALIGQTLLPKAEA